MLHKMYTIWILTINHGIVLLVILLFNVALIANNANVIRIVPEYLYIVNICKEIFQKY